MFFYFSLFLWVIGSYNLLASETSNYYFPPEWETHSSLWVGVRTSKEGANYEPFLRKMFVHFADHVHLNMVIESSENFVGKERYLSKISPDSSLYTIMSTDSAYFWLRDTGPIFLKNAEGKIKILAAPFSAYQRLHGRKGSLAVTDHRHFIKTIQKLTGYDVLSSDIVLEGGAFDVNGKGVVLLSPVILDRNSQLTKIQIERKILKALGQKKAIWLKKGVAEDPYGFTRITDNYWGRGTGGHLDQYVRFVNKTTIVLAWIPEEEKNISQIANINFQRMQENYEILNAETDQDGKNFNIIKVPFPELITKEYIITAEQSSLYKQRNIDLKEGEKIEVVASASYVNFIITNNLVMIPKYGDTVKTVASINKDKKMFAIMRKLFPRHEIIQIDPLVLNWHGGGMHCIAQQQP